MSSCSVFLAHQENPRHFGSYSVASRTWREAEIRAVLFKKHGEKTFMGKVSGEIKPENVPVALI